MGVLAQIGTGQLLIIQDLIGRNEQSGGIRGLAYISEASTGVSEENQEKTLEESLASSTNRIYLLRTLIPRSGKVRGLGLNSRDQDYTQ